MNNINAYLQQLNEETVKGYKYKPNSSLDGADKNGKINPLKVGNIPDAGIETPEEPEHLQGVTNEEGVVKHNNMRNNDPFERLYRQAINEDFDENPTSGGMGGDEFGGGLGDDNDADMEFGDEGGDIDANPEHVGKVKEVVELLQQALDLLQNFEGEEEEEYSEYEGEDEGDDFGGDDFGGGDEEPVAEEQTDMKSLGHALVNRDQLNKGMNKPSNMTVKGAVPNVGKKAQSPTEKRGDGKLSNMPDKKKQMQGKGNMKVKAKRYDTPNRFAFED